MNTQFIIFFLIIVLGCLLKHFSIVKEHDGECLARIVFNITLPSLILVTFSQVTMDASLIALTVISVVYGCIMAAMGLYMFRGELRTTRGMLGMILPGFNIGLFAFPLVEVIWGKEGLKYFGMFDIGNSIVTFVVCYLIANYFSEEEAKWTFGGVITKLSKSIPLLTYIVTFFFVISGLQLPGPVLDIAGLLAKANAPLSLLLLGMYVSFSFKPDYLKNAGKVLAFRYAIGLAVGLAFFFAAPVEKLFRYTLLIGFVLPIAAAVIPFAIEFHYDQKFVGAVANLTILISFVLVWLITGTSLIN